MSQLANLQCFKYFQNCINLLRINQNPPTDLNQIGNFQDLYINQLDHRYSYFMLGSVHDLELGHDS